ncbi:MAG: 50S ribosomal protein L25 [Patescibacteria group bacterium]
MVKLEAKKRKITGKKVKTLRRAGVLPAVVFGGKDPSQTVELNQIKFEKVYREAGEATIIDLEMDGKNQDVLISDVQVNPLGKIIHTDLKRVAAGELITATVPIEVIGESPIVKSAEAILLTILDEVEVECYPRDLPSAIKVDVSNLMEIGQGIEIKDLPINHEKVKIQGHELNEMVVKTDYLQEEEVVEEAPVSEEEAIAGVEALEEKKLEEGEEGAAPAEEAPQEKKKEEKKE